MAGGTLATMPAPRQLMFLATTEADLHDPILTAQALDDIRSHGFDGIYLEYRNLKTPLEAPRARAGIARIAAQAQERGLAVALDVSANHLHPHLVREHPEAFVEALKPYWLRAADGRTELVTGGEPLHHVIIGVWSVQRRADGGATVQPAAWRETACLVEGGGCAMTEQRGIAPTRHTHPAQGARRDGRGRRTSGAQTGRACCSARSATATSTTASPPA